jgi:hypothetical protein
MAEPAMRMDAQVARMRRDAELALVATMNAAIDLFDRVRTLSTRATPSVSRHRARALNFDLVRAVHDLVDHVAKDMPAVPPVPLPAVAPQRKRARKPGPPALPPVAGVALGDVWAELMVATEAVNPTERAVGQVLQTCLRFASDVWLDGQLPSSFAAEGGEGEAFLWLHDRFLGAGLRADAEDWAAHTADLARGRFVGLQPAYARMTDEPALRAVAQDVSRAAQQLPHWDAAAARAALVYNWPPPSAATVHPGVIPRAVNLPLASDVAADDVDDPRLDGFYDHVLFALALRERGYAPLAVSAIMEPLGVLPVCVAAAALGRLPWAVGAPPTASMARPMIRPHQADVHLFGADLDRMQRAAEPAAVAVPSDAPYRSAVTEAVRAHLARLAQAWLGDQGDADADGIILGTYLDALAEAVDAPAPASRAPLLAGLLRLGTLVPLLEAWGPPPAPLPEAADEEMAQMYTMLLLLNELQAALHMHVASAAAYETAVTRAPEAPAAAMAEAGVLRDMHAQFVRQLDAAYPPPVRRLQAYVALVLRSGGHGPVPPVDEHRATTGSAQPAPHALPLSAELLQVISRAPVYLRLLRDYLGACRALGPGEGEGGWTAAVWARRETFELFGEDMGWLPSLLESLSPVAASAGAAVWAQLFAALGLPFTWAEAAQLATEASLRGGDAALQRALDWRQSLADWWLPRPPLGGVDTPLGAALSAALWLVHTRGDGIDAVVGLTPAPGHARVRAWVDQLRDVLEAYGLLPIESEAGAQYAAAVLGLYDAHGQLAVPAQSATRRIVARRIVAGSVVLRPLAATEARGGPSAAHFPWCMLGDFCGAVDADLAHDAVALHVRLQRLLFAAAGR